MNFCSHSRDGRHYTGRPGNPCTSGIIRTHPLSGQPAANTSIPLLAVDATVTIAGSESERKVPLTTFFLYKGQTVLDCPREILTSIQFKGLKETVDSLKTLLNVDVLNEGDRPIVSFEIKPTEGQDSSVMIAGAKRMMQRAWALA